MIQVLKRVEDVLVSNSFANCKIGKLSLELLELLLRCERKEKCAVLFLADDVDICRGSSDLFGLYLVGQGDLDETSIVIATEVGFSSLARRPQAFTKQLTVPAGIIRWQYTGKPAPRPSLDDWLLAPQL